MSYLRNETLRAGVPPYMCWKTGLQFLSAVLPLFAGMQPVLRCPNVPLNPLNAELNPVCHLLALLGVHPIFHVSRVRVNAVSYKQQKFYPATLRKPIPLVHFRSSAHRHAGDPTWAVVRKTFLLLVSSLLHLHIRLFLGLHCSVCVSWILKTHNVTSLCSTSCERRLCPPSSIGVESRLCPACV
jgi:hypothetical protein